MDNSLILAGLAAGALSARSALCTRDGKINEGGSEAASGRKGLYASVNDSDYPLVKGVRQQLRELRYLKKKNPDEVGPPQRREDTKQQHRD